MVFDRLLTVADVAALLRLTNKGVYSLVEARRIPFVRVSNRVRFILEDVVAWLSENRVRPWRDDHGCTTNEGAWWVDFRYERERYRRRSPVNTKRGAEEHERRVRQQIQDGTFEKEEMPTFGEWFYGRYWNEVGGCPEEQTKHRRGQALGLRAPLEGGIRQGAARRDQGCERRAFRAG